MSWVFLSSSNTLSSNFERSWVEYSLVQALFIIQRATYFKPSIFSSIKFNSSETKSNMKYSWAGLACLHH